MGTSTVLSDEELGRYRRDGFLVPQVRLSEETVDRLLAATLKLIADRPELIDQSIVGPP